jgi:arsenate reductase
MGLSIAFDRCRAADLSFRRRTGMDGRIHRNHGKPMTPTLYGIPNCDTMKKARTWLDANGIGYTFHDYKKAGIDRATLEQWVEALGWEALLNRSGTTFRKLPDADRADLDAPRAIDLMLAQPSMIRRPVLVGDDWIETGFKPERYAERFAIAG